MVVSNRFQYVIHSFALFPSTLMVLDNISVSVIKRSRLFYCCATVSIKQDVCLNFNFRLTSSAVPSLSLSISSRLCLASSPLPFPLKISCAVHTGCSHVVCVVEQLFQQNTPSSTNTCPIFNLPCLKILTTTLSLSPPSLPACLPPLP